MLRDDRPAQARIVSPFEIFCEEVTAGAVLFWKELSKQTTHAQTEDTACFHSKKNQACRLDGDFRIFYYSNLSSYSGNIDDFEGHCKSERKATSAAFLVLPKRGEFDSTSSDL